MTTEKKKSFSIIINLLIILATVWIIKAMVIQYKKYEQAATESVRLECIGNKAYMRGLSTGELHPVFSYQNKHFECNI